MEFNFNINAYFKDEITKVGSRLIPDGFIGDRREVQDCLSKVSYILTVLGEKSAKAQGLQKVITSGEKLRNSDHVVYILIDSKGGSRGFGTVVGMLKIGVKHLYVFDAGGNNHEVSAKCVLDFYVHESKQRMGLGKKLFQYMLKEERVDPVHLAIDKPSSKFLSFLLKHYGLQKVIPQMNNFVVFDGFFSNRLYEEELKKTIEEAGAEGGTGGKEKKIAAGVSSVGDRYSSGSSGYSLSSSPKTYHCQSVSSVNLNNSSYYGRQAPHKPVSTMGMILQQKPGPSQQPPQNASKIMRGTFSSFASAIVSDSSISKEDILPSYFDYTFPTPHESPLAGGATPPMDKPHENQVGTGEAETTAMETPQSDAAEAEVFSEKEDSESAQTEPQPAVPEEEITEVTAPIAEVTAPVTEVSTPNSPTESSQTVESEAAEKTRIPGQGPSEEVEEEEEGLTPEQRTPNRAKRKTEQVEVLLAIAQKAVAKRIDSDRMFAEI